MSAPLVITYDNAPTEATRFFIKTLDTNGWNYILVGEGDTWEGFRSKINGYHTALKSLPDDKLVILSDARDVVCLRSPKAFLDGFSIFKSDMVVSMELFCDGDITVDDTYVGRQCVSLTQYWKHHTITSLPKRKFVNSGLIAGKVRNILHWLEWAIANGYRDDQLALGQYMNNFPEKISVDTGAVLLHTSTFGVNAGLQYVHIQKEDSPTLAELYGRSAFFLHIPGCKGKGQKVVYDDVCSVLKLGMSDISLRKQYNFKEPSWHGFDGYST